MPEMIENLNNQIIGMLPYGLHDAVKVAVDFDGDGELALAIDISELNTIDGRVFAYLTPDCLSKLINQLTELNNKTKDSINDTKGKQ